MALTVEDGTGYANADSYVSVAEADGYHSALGNEAWAALEPGRKEVLLRRATNYISDVYRTAFAGAPAKAGQSLAWPRIPQTVLERPLVPLASVPRGVREATIELALIADKTELLPNPKRLKKSVKIGPLAVEYADEPSGEKFVAASLKLAANLRPIAGNPFMARVVRV